MPLHFKLVTPERILFEEDASSVTLPTSEGEITILPKHVPLVAALKPGVAELTRADGATEDIAVSGGFIQVMEGDRVTVLADTAERGEELTMETIEKAKKHAEELMRQKKFAGDASFAEAAAALERELARYKTVVRHRARKGLPVLDRANLPKSKNEV
ncbi:ATP synthase F1 subunit epsilon [Candidatus Uhrbacteria bacterium RIFCSPHIGHO2_12_FULL_60_25]|uniref:ATP synthase epsilon chain n=1 Tax=Candidatus Uhrbacteria bacterium RIFCSPHIGHO2_12_FULL_60_25 TaxID=1802399 RepID=A0A1F7UK50_9BACT|nr:MAG: ATP synthase F1 subunit epsilon [Candidatus Uhrbacteria bacterium RIFCSPHIGHO2_02_FULL_60_44]OGL78104.1 MAG: ATP synthase F1 subunit epsilon [Candidatus Uhrbacteria bacterium RIFCSPHIGHO2_12_FULL_60_25]